MELATANDLTRWLTVAYCVFGVATLTTFVRLLARLRLFRGFGIDDVLIALATLCAAAVIATEHGMTVCFRDFINGNGGLATFSPTNSAMGRFVEGMKFQYVGSNIYMPTIAFIKLSLLAFYDRFLPSKPYRWILLVLAAATIILVTSTTLAGVFACTPMAANWNPRVPGAKCRVETYHTHFTNGVFGIITDFIILFLPIPTVVRLRTDRKKKMALITIFSVGLVGTAVTILRMVKLLNIRRTPMPLIVVFLGRIMDNIMWSMVEISVLIVCANLPGIYALSRRGGPQTTPASSGAAVGSSRNKPTGSYYSSDNRTPRRLSGFGHSVRRSATDIGVAVSAYGDPYHQHLHHNRHQSRGSAPPPTSASEEAIIIQEPDCIHLQTRVVVDVEP